MFILGVKYDRTFSEKYTRVQVKYNHCMLPACVRISGGDAENFSE